LGDPQPAVAGPAQPENVQGFTWCLPAGFDPARYHTLTVVKANPTFTFSLDGKQLQQRTFQGASPVLLNGQVGIVTEDTEANYRNVRVYNTK